MLVDVLVDVDVDVDVDVLVEETAFLLPEVDPPVARDSVGPPRITAAASRPAETARNEMCSCSSKMSDTGLALEPTCNGGDDVRRRRCGGVRRRGCGGV